MLDKHDRKASVRVGLFFNGEKLPVSGRQDDGDGTPTSLPVPHADGGDK